jgi:hypothetical protein
MNLLNRIGEWADRLYSRTPWEQLKDWKRAYKITFIEWQRALARCREQESFIKVQSQIMELQATTIRNYSIISNN